MIERAVRAVVFGRVQGVFFREHTRRQAERLGLAGWVRNRRDGSVEAFLQGSHDAVEQLVIWLHRGSPEADVERVETDAAEPDPTLTSFRVTV